MPELTTPTLTIPGGAIPVLGFGTWQAEGPEPRRGRAPTPHVLAAVAERTGEHAGLSAYRGTGPVSCVGGTPLCRRGKVYLTSGRDVNHSPARGHAPA